jgi:chlorobactene glucosyltransferase
MGQNIITNILLYLQIAVVLVLSILTIITLSNLKYLRRLRSYKFSATWPRISVLVPARNEEENIGKCVSSLLKQDYPDFQLIVLDDNSNDKTWEILQEFARRDDRLKIIKGKPLPDDWLGKHWACHQLFEEADGELLLFVDADTIHEPDMLKYAASAMYEENASLISVLPQQIVISWSELLSIPAFYLGMLCGVPLGLTRLQRNPLLFACLGQFLMFRREAYVAAGGYASVRQNILDDLAIGRRIHSMGLCYRLLDGHKLIYCRMYNTFEQVWKGLTKSTFATFDFNPFFITSICLLIILIFLSPPVILLSSYAFHNLPVVMLITAGIALLLIIIIWIISNLRFHFPLYLVLIYPASVTFMVIIAMASMVLTIQGKATWKGRNMPRFVKL